MLYCFYLRSVARNTRKSLNSDLYYVLLQPYVLHERFFHLWCPAFVCLRVCFIKLGIILRNLSLSCAQVVPKPPHPTMAFQMPLFNLFIFFLADRL